MKKSALPTGSSYTYLNKILLPVLLTLFYISGISQDAVGDYRSNATSFNWSAAASWQVCTIAGNPGTFATASTYPGQNSGTGKVAIRNGHTVTLNVTPTSAINALAIGEGSSGHLKFERSIDRSLTISTDVILSSGASFMIDNNGNGANDILYIGGNLVNGGNITTQTRNKISFVFNGTAAQTCSGTGITTIANVTVSNTSVAGVTFNAPLTATSSTNVGSGATLALGAAFSNPGGATTINGTLRINPGGKVSSAPIYTNSSILYYHTATATTGKEWNGTGTVAGAGTPMNVTLDLSTVSNEVIIAGRRTVPGVLHFIKGLLTTGAYSLTAGTVSGASSTSGWINGSLIKSILTTGTTVFDVGSAFYYTPASLKFTSINMPGQLQVSTKTPMSSQSGLNKLLLDINTNFLNRYWQITKPVADAFACTYVGSFTYAASDLTGDPTALRTGVYSNSVWTYPGVSIPGALQLAVAGGITQTAGTTRVVFAGGKYVTIAGVVADNKIYDGNTNATLHFTSATIKNNPGGLTINAAAAVGTFNNKNVGTNKAVTITGVSFSGTNSGAYIPLFQPSPTASITAAPLTITAITNTKFYDGTTNAAAIPSITSGAIQAGDVANFIEVYDNPGIGTNKTLIPSGTVTDGNSGNNYTYTFINNNTGIITAIPVTIADFRTKANGDFSNFGNTWEYDQGAGTWVTATAAPTSTNNVTVRHELTLDQNFTVGIGKMLTLDASLHATDTFKIAAAKTLFVNGTANFNGHPVTIQSTSIGSGSIGNSSGIFNGATNVTIERYIPANNNRAWRLLAIPTSGGQSIHNSWQEGQAATVNGIPGFGTILTASGANALANGFDYKTPGNAMFTYAPATDALVGVPSTANAIATTSGYFVYLRGDRSVGPSSSITGTTATTLRTTGGIYTGAQPAIMIPADQDALIGNIYPSTIDIRRLIKTDGAENTSFAVWDPSLAGSQGLGAYQTLILNGSDYEITPGGGSYGSGGSIHNTIQSGQAFFVSATGTNGTIQFVENAKTSGSSSNVFSAPVTKKLSAKLYTITANGKDLSDGTMQLFDDSFSNDVDVLDAKKHYNFGENFYITRNGKDLVVEKHKLLTEKDTIYFAIESLTSKSYQFEFDARELEAGNLSAILEDNYTHTRTPVSLSGITTAPFSVDGNAASKAIDRFRIVFTSNIVLAVGITNAKAYAATTSNVIEWNVSNQRDARNYQVERSLNGIDFGHVATLAASGVDYRWVDQAPSQGNNFYRITIIENNGSKHYSQVMKVSFSKNAGITVTPNIITNGVINMQFGSMPKGNYGVRLIGTNGSVLAVKKFYYDGIGVIQSVNIPGSLATGSYTLDVIHPDKTRTTHPVVIAK